MKTIWLVLFISSLTVLMLVLFRKKITWSGLSSFAVHLALAAGVIYVLNYSGLISDLYIPLNPYTVGTVVVLGIPGIALIAGVQWLML